jgi:hypothetical protein
VVVALGLTDCVPPVAWSVYVLPSDPVTVTCVAFAAVTVRVDELPETIAVGLAVMFTAGAGSAVTATVAFAETFPPVPDAAAVYVVVAPGLTFWVPPDAARVYVLPSDPDTVT